MSPYDSDSSLFLLNTVTRLMLSTSKYTFKNGDKKALNVIIHSLNSIDTISLHMYPINIYT